MDNKIIFVLYGLVKNYEKYYKSLMINIEQLKNTLNITIEIYVEAWDIDGIGCSRTSYTNNRVDINDLKKKYNPAYININNLDKWKNNNLKFNEKIYDKFKKLFPSNKYNIKYIESLTGRFYLINKTLQIVKNKNKNKNVFIYCLRFDSKIINFISNKIKQIINTKDIIYMNNYCSLLRKNIYKDYVFCGNIDVICKLSEINYHLEKIIIPKNEWTIESIITKYCKDNMKTEYLPTVIFIDRLGKKY